MNTARNEPLHYHHTITNRVLHECHSSIREGIDIMASKYKGSTMEAEPMTDKELSDITEEVIGLLGRLEQDLTDLDRLGIAALVETLRDAINHKEAVNASLRDNLDQQQENMRRLKARCDHFADVLKALEDDKDATAYFVPRKG